MSDNTLATYLKAELQLLSTEAKKKYPEVKEASERVIVVLRGHSNKDKTSKEIASELAKSEDVLRPLSMALDLRVPKLVAVAMRCIQRLTQYKAIANTSIREVLKSMNKVSDIDTDTQIKILQIILPLVRNYDSIRDATLAEAFLLCFKLQESASSDPVILMTAAVTIRQLVDVVFERVAAINTADGESRQSSQETKPERSVSPVNSIGGSSINTQQSSVTSSLGSIALDPSVKDAYFILKDLCLMIKGEEPVFIRGPKLKKSFGYELIESIISNHHNLFPKYAELSKLVAVQLAPIFIQFLINPGPELCSFQAVPLQFRLIHLFIKHWSQTFSKETSIFLNILIRLIDSIPNSDETTAALLLCKDGKFLDDTLEELNDIKETTLGRSLMTPIIDLEEHKNAPKDASVFIDIPLNYRALSLEVIRNILSDVGLVRVLYELFDLEDKNEDNKKKQRNKDWSIGAIITSLGKVVTERPDICSPSSAESWPRALLNEGNGGGIESSTVAENTKFGDMATLMTLDSVTLRTSLLQSFEKSTIPRVPENYLYYLSLVSIIDLVNGMARPILDKRIHCPTTQVQLRILNSDDKEQNSHDPITKLTEDWADSNWPVLLATFSFFMNVTMEPALFEPMLASQENLINLLGVFGMTSARDSFFSLLYRHCIPNSSVSHLERKLQQKRDSEEPTAKSKSQANSMLTKETKIPFLLNYGNIQALTSLLNCAGYLANSLGPLWYPVLITYQQAEEILYRNYGISEKQSSNVAEGGTLSSPVGGGHDNSSTPGVNGNYNNTNTRGLLVSQHQFTSMPNLARKLVSRFDQLLQSVEHFTRDTSMWFISSLCLLGSDLGGIPTRNENKQAIQDMTGLANFQARISVAVSRMIFPIRILRYLAINNMDKLLDINDNEAAETKGIFKNVSPTELILHYLLDTATFIDVAPELRTFSCEVVSEVVLIAMDRAIKITTEEDEESTTKRSDKTAQEKASRNDDIQLQILTPLAQMMMMMMPTEKYNSNDSFSDTDQKLFTPTAEVQSLALETLNKLLQTSGQSIVNAWDVIFDILQSVVDGVSINSGAQDDKSGDNEKPTEGHNKSKIKASIASKTTLIKASFACLQLICSDFLSILPPGCLRRCVRLIGNYGHQTLDLNLALTSIGLAWDVSNHLRDQVQNLKNHDTTVYSGDCGKNLEEALSDNVDLNQIWSTPLDSQATTVRNVQLMWLLLIHSISKLCTDSRSEVRNGTIQTIFRMLDMHGQYFEPRVWNTLLWRLLHPMVDQVFECRLNKVFECFVALKEPTPNADDNHSNEAVGDQGQKPKKTDHLVMTRSGVWIENPHSLGLKQWDETLTMVLQGIVKVWATNPLLLAPKDRSIFIKDQLKAWEKLWNWIYSICCYNFDGGSSSQSQDALKNIQVPSKLVDVLELKRMLFSKHIVKLSVDLISQLVEACKSELVINQGSGRDEPSLQLWQVSWSNIINIGLGVTGYLPNQVNSGGGDADNSHIFSNVRDNGEPIYTQDWLVKFVEILESKVLDVWIECDLFVRGNLQELLDLLRSLVLYFDAPSYTSDTNRLTKLQEVVLGTLQKLESLTTANGAVDTKGEGKKESSLDAIEATRILVDEYAKYTNLPYVILGEMDEKIPHFDSKLLSDQFSSAKGSCGKGSLDRYQEIWGLPEWKKRMSHYNNIPIRPTLISLAKQTIQRMSAVFIKHLLPKDAKKDDNESPGSYHGVNSETIMSLLKGKEIVTIILSAGIALSYSLNQSQDIETRRSSLQQKEYKEVAEAIQSVWPIAADSLLALIPSVLGSMSAIQDSLSPDIIQSTWSSLVTILEIVLAKSTVSVNSQHQQAGISEDSEEDSNSVVWYQVSLLNTVLVESLRYINQVKSVANSPVLDKNGKGSNFDKASSKDALVTMWLPEWKRIISLLQHAISLPGVLDNPYMIVATPDCTSTAKNITDMSLEFVSLTWLFALCGKLDFNSSGSANGASHLLYDIGGLETLVNRYKFIVTSISDAGKDESGPDGDTNSESSPVVPLEISRIAAPALLKHCHLVLTHYNKYRLLFQNSATSLPLPGLYYSTVAFILYYLSILEFRSGIYNALSKPNKDTDINGISSPLGNLVQSCEGEKNIHIRYLYPSLCDLVSCSDSFTVYLVQKCLRRLSFNIDISNF
ncbi:Endocytosis and vacuole integrity protein [Mycoemilia scoparia]|uniref:Endocytosis and vacuole integrity protein n=1 Tax=Mycoemilia scoparia TaxID=417184 RepID=A0A9W7ZU26_9FUNG|nr:Endocytosis and vacuole integrity protein [Mycoemilia scoparia]